MQQYNRKTPLIFKLGVGVFFALLLTVYFSNGLYARYSTTATSSDSARVARFSFVDNFDEQSQVLPSVLSPGESTSTSISIKNDGEVALVYVVKINNLTNNLPIDDQTITSDTIYPGEETTFVWSLDWPKEDNSISYMGKMDLIKITVTVEQAD